jgi:SAM-dependent methyltransferase
MKYTGERFMPDQTGEIKYEHLHRYALSQVFVRDKEVLDIACGEGYGAAFLAKYARTVCGIDIDTEIIEHAQREYGGHENLEFRVGSCDAIPMPDESVDVVTSFETIEHHDRHGEMLREIRRVLRPDGHLIISSPNRPIYSERSGFSNPFHVKELDYEEFVDLLKQHFAYVEVYGQKLAAGSFVFQLEDSRPCDFAAYAGNGNGTGKEDRILESPRYFIAVCSDVEMERGRELTSVYLDEHENLFQETLDGLTNLRVEHQRVIEYYERIRLELENIKTSFGFKLLRRVLWPLGRAVVPGPLRSYIKSAVLGLKRVPTNDAGNGGTHEELVWKIDTDLSRPFAVGRGNQFYFGGNCYHSRKRIKRLSVLVDGEPHRVVNHSLADGGALEEGSTPVDEAGNNFTSGFWTALPFAQLSAPRSAGRRERTRGSPGLASACAFRAGRRTDCRFLRK